MTSDGRSGERLNAGRAIVGKVIAEEISKGNKRMRELVEPTLEPGEKVKAQLPGGLVVGSVQRTETPRAVRVNLTQLMPWVEKNRPDQMTSTIQDAYLTHLMQLCKKHGHAIDESTGEIIPGIELADGTPSFRVTPNEEGRAYILSRLAEIADIGILELPNEHSE